MADRNDYIVWISNLIRREADAAQVNFRFFAGRHLQRISAVMDFSKNILPARRVNLSVLALFPGLYNLHTSRRFLIT